MADEQESADRSSIGRILLILRAMPADGGTTTLTRLAAEAGLPLSTTHRLVASLVDAGLLHRGEDRRYAVGTGLWELGERSPVARRLREAAMPELTELYDRTGENAHVAVLIDREVLYVARASGSRAVPTLARVGVRHPLHATGVGRAILAELPDDVVRELLGDDPARITPFTLTDPARLNRELAATRKRGYARTRQEMTLGNASLAVALAPRPGLPRAAVGVVTHLATADERRLVPLLTRARDGIERQLDSFH